ALLKDHDLIEAISLEQFEFATTPDLLPQRLKPSAQQRDNVQAKARTLANSVLRFGGADRDRTGDPLLAKQVLSQLSYSPITRVVGLGRFELPTSPLSGVRSNQLSYRPAGCASVSPFYWNNRCAGCSVLIQKNQESSSL